MWSPSVRLPSCKIRSTICCSSEYVTDLDRLEEKVVSVGDRLGEDVVEVVGMLIGDRVWHELSEKNLYCMCECVWHPSG